MARMTAEFGNGRVEYSYQPQVPLLAVVLHLGRYGFTKKTRAGLRVPDPFWRPTSGIVREWKQQATGASSGSCCDWNPAIRTAASPARSAR